MSLVFSKDRSGRAYGVRLGSDTVSVAPRNGFSADHPRCDLERIAIVVHDGDGDEDYAQVVVPPNDLAALLYAKNRLWGRDWHYQESWQVAHPCMGATPKFMAIDGPGGENCLAG